MTRLLCATLALLLPSARSFSSCGRTAPVLRGSFARVFSAAMSDTSDGGGSGLPSGPRTRRDSLKHFGSVLCGSALCVGSRVTAAHAEESPPSTDKMIEGFVLKDGLTYFGASTQSPGAL